MHTYYIFNSFKDVYIHIAYIYICCVYIIQQVYVSVCVVYMCGIHVWYSWEWVCSLKHISRFPPPNALHISIDATLHFKFLTYSNDITENGTQVWHSRAVFNGAKEATCPSLLSDRPLRVSLFAGIWGLERLVPITPSCNTLVRDVLRWQGMNMIELSLTPVKALSSGQLYSKS